VNDRTHGQQFKAQFLKTSAPTSIEGIEKYLGSGMIRGIGPVYARKLVRAFGEKVFDTIEAEPERLREVTGIGPVRAKRITAAWAEHPEAAALVGLLEHRAEEAPDARLAERQFYRKALLFDRFLTFDVRTEQPETARH
jgi:NAD-dependent DNA ligase